MLQLHRALLSESSKTRCINYGHWNIMFRLIGSPDQVICYVYYYSSVEMYINSDQIACFVMNLPDVKN